MNSNNRETKNSDIEALVLKNFIIVLKQNDMYPFFRCSVGTSTNNVISSLYMRLNSFRDVIIRQRKDNIFRDSPTIESCADMLKQTLGGGLNNNEKSPAKIQHHIANCVNTLLHTFVERNVRDFHKLEHMGGMIFDMSCRAIFGDEFKDVLPPPPASAQVMRQINEYITNTGQRPTREMLEQIRQMIESQQIAQNPELSPLGQPPLVEEGDDWDFLDDFLGENDEEDGEEWDEEDERDEDDEDAWEYFDDDDWR